MLLVLNSLMKTRRSKERTVTPFANPKTSPLEDDDLVEEEAIEVNKTRPLGNDLEDKSLENNEIINIKESKSHPLENVIGAIDLSKNPIQHSCTKHMEIRHHFLPDNVQTPSSPQVDNQTQPPPPPSPSIEIFIDDINQLQDLSNLLDMHLS
ncbi:hypothetical protein Tco_1296221 [Tanacetum coccineum]